MNTSVYLGQTKELGERLDIRVRESGVNRKGIQLVKILIKTIYSFTLGQTELAVLRSHHSQCMR